MTYHVAVDIGGTNMRAASYPLDSLTPHKHNRVPTQGNDQKPEDRLMGLIRSIWPEDGAVQSIGMASPGPLNPYTGIVLCTPNIPQWCDFPLAAFVREHFQVPVSLCNDANLAALGEWRYGAGRGHSHLIYLTISTGIGSGVIIDNVLLLGARGLAPELGHLTVLPEGPVCSCGHRGHLEAVASGPAIARWYEEHTQAQERKLTAKDVAKAAQAGDTLAQEAFARAGTFIGHALADALSLFNPSLVILGGGVTHSGALLIEPIKAAMKQYAFTPHYLENLTLTTAQLGDDAGLLGALALARSKVSE